MTKNYEQGRPKSQPFFLFSPHFFLLFIIYSASLVCFANCLVRFWNCSGQSIMNSLCYTSMNNETKFSSLVFRVWLRRQANSEKEQKGIYLPKFWWEGGLRRLTSNRLTDLEERNSRGTLALHFLLKPMACFQSWCTPMLIKHDGWQRSCHGFNWIEWAA